MTELFELEDFLFNYLQESGCAVQENVKLHCMTVEFYCPDKKLAIAFYSPDKRLNKGSCKKITKDGINLIRFLKEPLSVKAIQKRLDSIGRELLKIKMAEEFEQRKAEALKRVKKSDEFNPPETLHELILLAELERQGYKVIHNEKLHGYYPDLLLPDWDLIVEVDGKYHDSPERISADRKRTKILKSHGYTVLRVRNETIDKSLPRAVHMIRMVIERLNKKKRDKDKLLRLKRKKKLKVPPEKVSHSHRRLVNDPNWESLACQKLGIDPAKPKRTPINA